MRQSVIKVGINNFFNDIKFDEKYYSIYNDILDEKILLTEDLFFLIIMQTSLQTKFYGYFDELYVDVCKRKNEYIRELLLNFRKAAVEPPSYYNKIKKLCCFYGRMTEKEIIFGRKISFFNFDTSIDELFNIKDNTKRDKFISICENIYNGCVVSKLEEKIDLKLKNKIKKK